VEKIDFRSTIPNVKDIGEVVTGYFTIRRTGGRDASDRWFSKTTRKLLRIIKFPLSDTCILCIVKTIW